MYPAHVKPLFSSTTDSDSVILSSLCPICRNSLVFSSPPVDQADTFICHPRRIDWLPPFLLQGADFRDVLFLPRWPQRLRCLIVWRQL